MTARRKNDLPDDPYERSLIWVKAVRLVTDKINGVSFGMKPVKTIADLARLVYIFGDQSSIFSATKIIEFKSTLLEALFSNKLKEKECAEAIFIGTKRSIISTLNEPFTCNRPVLGKDVALLKNVARLFGMDRDFIYDL